MFGAHCFLVCDHMFAFTWHGDVAMWVPDAEYESDLSKRGVQTVEIRRGIPMGTWLRFPRNQEGSLLPRLRASYEHYRDHPPKRRRRRAKKPRSSLS